MAKRYSGKARRSRKSSGLTAEQQLELYINAIIDKNCSPCRPYDRTYAPMSLNQYLKHLTRGLNNAAKISDPDRRREMEAKAYKHARIKSRYSGGNVMRVMMAAHARGLQYPIAGTFNGWVKALLDDGGGRFLAEGSDKVMVKAGSKQFPIKLFKPGKAEDDLSAGAKSKTSELEADAGPEDKKNRAFFGERGVLLLEQTEGIDIEAFLGPEEADPPEFNAQRFTEAFVGACSELGVGVTPGVVGNTAFFAHSPVDPDGAGEVRVPGLRGFTSAEEWAGASLHELSHAIHYQTEREAFKLGPQAEGSKFHGWSKDEKHAYLEIIAESSAGILMISTGIMSPAYTASSASYLKSYLGALQTMQAGGKAELVYDAIGMAGVVAGKALATAPFREYVKELGEAELTREEAAELAHDPVLQEEQTRQQVLEDERERLLEQAPGPDGQIDPVKLFDLLREGLTDKSEPATPVREEPAPVSAGLGR